MEYERSPRGRLVLDGAHEFLWVIDAPNGEETRTDLPPDVIGIAEFHRADVRGGWCGGYVYWAGPDARHQLVSLDPLHIEPSLLCPTCGSHGFVREGRWVDVPS